MRMYFLVMYNLSGIQKGIQAGHAAVEYARENGTDDDFQDFARNHKTFIVLDGGTSETMKEHFETLRKAGVKCSHFIEPDLNNSMSAIAFLVDEESYEHEAYFFSDDEERGFRRGDPEPINVSRPTWLAWFIKQFKLASN